MTQNAAFLFFIHCISCIVNFKEKIFFLIQGKGVGFIPQEIFLLKVGNESKNKMKLFSGVVVQHKEAEVWDESEWNIM